MGRYINALSVHTSTAAPEPRPLPGLDVSALIDRELEQELNSILLKQKALISSNNERDLPPGRL
jgi:hypothetical protein